MKTFPTPGLGEEEPPGIDSDSVAVPTDPGFVDTVSDDVVDVVDVGPWLADPVTRALSAEEVTT